MALALLGGAGWQPAVTDDPVGTASFVPVAGPVAAGEVILIVASNAGSISDDGGNSYEFISSYNHVFVYRTIVTSPMAPGYAIASNGIYAFEAFWFSGATGNVNVVGIDDTFALANTGTTEEKTTSFDYGGVKWGDRYFVWAAGWSDTVDAGAVADIVSSPPDSMRTNQPTGTDQSAADTTAGINFRPRIHVGFGSTSADDPDPGNCGAFRTAILKVVAVGSGSISSSGVGIELEINGATVCPTGPPDDDVFRRGKGGANLQSVLGMYYVADALGDGIRLRRSDDTAPPYLTDVQVSENQYDRSPCLEEIWNGERALLLPWVRDDPDLGPSGMEARSHDDGLTFTEAVEMFPGASQVDVAQSPWGMVLRAALIENALWISQQGPGDSEPGEPFATEVGLNDRLFRIAPAWEGPGRWFLIGVQGAEGEEEAVNYTSADDGETWTQL